MSFYIALWWHDHQSFTRSFTLSNVALARLMSDEVLENEWDQISETGSHNGGDKSKPSDSGN